MLAEDVLGRPLAFAELASFLGDDLGWAGDLSYALRLRGVTGVLVSTENATYMISKHAPRYYLIEAM
jgi:hypothetical protein